MCAGPHLTRVAVVRADRLKVNRVNDLLPRSRSPSGGALRPAVARCSRRCVQRHAPGCRDLHAASAGRSVRRQAGLLHSRRRQRRVACRSGGMADARDSKSRVRKGVWVRLPPPALSPLAPRRGRRRWGAADTPGAATGPARSVTGPLGVRVRPRRRHPIAARAPGARVPGRMAARREGLRSTSRVPAPFGVMAARREGLRWSSPDPVSPVGWRLGARGFVEPLA